MSKIIKNSLGYDSNLFVYQDKQMFNYSIDTILLANFLKINNSIKKILEIGANNGAMAIFISERKEDLKIDAIEIQERAIKLAKKNLKLNKKTKQINLIHQDFNDFVVKHPKNTETKYDSIVCNPPFYKIDNFRINKNINDELKIANYEFKLNLKQIIEGSSLILKTKGFLNLVLPTERLVDAIELLRKNKFELKRVQFIFPRTDQKSNLVLLEARLDSGWGTVFLPNIYLHPEDKNDSSYLPKIKNLYKPIVYKSKGSHDEK